MKKEELASIIGKPLFSPLKNLFLIGVLCLISSLFIWIWVGFILAVKVFFTSIIAVFIIALFYKFVQKCVNEIIDEEMKKEQPKAGKSKFQQRLDEVMEQQKQAK